MNKGDIVFIVTGCTDCGDVEAMVVDIVDDRALVSVVGELPHKAKERVIWIDTKRLRAKEYV